MKLTFNKVFFTPWVGENYFNGMNGKRILIIGESVFCLPPNQCPCYKAIDNSCNYGFDLVDKVLKGTKVAFFTKIYKILSGNNLLSEKEFWNSISFYEYIQQSVGTKPKDRPNGEMWVNAKEPFLEVLEKLNPTFILIAGKSISDAIYSFNNINSIEKFEGKPFAQFAKLIFLGREIEIVSINHPSAPGFSYNHTDFINSKYYSQ